VAAHAPDGFERDSQFLACQLHLSGLMIRLCFRAAQGLRVRLLQVMVHSLHLLQQPGLKLGPEDPM